MVKDTYPLPFVDSMACNQCTYARIRHPCMRTTQAPHMDYSLDAPIPWQGRSLAIFLPQPAPLVRAYIDIGLVG